MKKLLTILVSAASACFAFADGFTESGTSFESYVLDETGFAELKLSDQDADGKRYWLSGAKSDFGIVTNYQSDTAIPSDITRPTKFASETNNKYLRLDTSDTLFRTINSYGTIEEVITTNAVNIGEGIYFDSLVQFTATEDNVTPSEGDKLVVWLKAVEGSEGVEGSTNLMITAGKIINEHGNIGTVDYEGTVEGDLTIENNSWHRLTIKTFIENEAAVFEVYIDGKIVTGTKDAESTTKFLSRVAKGATGAKTISGVGFKGTGAVDDLAFTTSDPLYVAPSTYAISGPAEDVAGIISIDYTLDEAGDNPIENIGAIDVGTTEVWAYITLQDGYKLDSATYNGVPVTGNVIGKGILIRLAVDAPEANTTYSFVVNASVDASEDEPFSVKIGDTTTTCGTFEEALSAALDPSLTGIAEIKIAEGTGDVVVKAFTIEKSITIDLGNNTLVLKDPGVGANASIKSLGIRIGSEYTPQIQVTIKNGTIEVDNTGTENLIKMMIQNYADLTLTDVTLDGTNLVDPANDQPKYVLSNNRGTVLLNGSTSITVPTTGAKGSVAFDVCQFKECDIPTVTLSTTGTIGGVVEVTGGNFVYEGGTISGAIEFSSGTISVADAIEDQIAVPAGKKLKEEGGVWTLVDDTDPVPTVFTITVTFGTGITGASYKIGDAEEAIALEDGKASAEIAKDTVVTITAVADDWYKAPEAQTITLDANKEITLEAEAVTSESIGDLKAEIPEGKDVDAVLAWAKSNNMSTAQVLAAPYLYEDYLFNFTQPSQAKPTIEITSITLVDGKATVEAKVTVDGVTKIETLTSATGLNGAVMYKAAETLDALKTATPKEAIEEGDQFIQIVVK